MGSGSTARVASRPCDGSAEAARYDAMFAPPPCATPVAKRWTPAVEPAPPMPLVAPALAHESICTDDLGSRRPVPSPRRESVPVSTDDPVVYLSSARLGRRSRSRNR